MFNEVSSLLNGNGQHVYDQDLSEYGLHVDDLDTEPIPTTSLNTLFQIHSLTEEQSLLYSCNTDFAQ